MIKYIGYIILAIVAIIGIVFVANLLSSTSDGSLVESGTTKVTCDISLRNAFLKDVEISDYDCNIVGKCGIFSVNTGFWIKDHPLVDYGKVKIQFGNAIARREYDVKEGTVDSYSLTVCTDTREGSIIAVDDNGKIVDQKEVTV